MNLASCDFARIPKNLANFIPIQLIVLPLSGPDMKYSIRVLHTFRFSPNYDYSVQMVEMDWFPIRILDNLRFSPNFD